MADAPKIEEREDGPLLAKYIPMLRDADGPIERKDAMALCRCGASSTKPFCDGSHNDIDFKSRDDKTPSGRDRVIAYAGKDITVNYNPMLCSHAAECGRMAKHVFDSDAKPWIQPDNGTVDEIKAVVAACPSGALSVAPSEGEVQHIVPDGAEIYVQKNGPYWVRHVPPPTAIEAEGHTDEKYVLCRCGLSGSKPFCDGSHSDANWRDDSD